MTKDQLFQQALKHHRAGKFNKAKKTYLSLLEIKPEHEDANYQLGLIERNEGAFAQAAERFTKAIAVNPEEGAYWVALIDTLVDAGDRKAVKLLREALRRGMAGGPIDRLASRIKATFPPVAKYIALGQVRPLAGGRYGQRQPVMLAELQINLPGAYSIENLRETIAGILRIDVLPIGLTGESDRLAIAELVLWLSVTLQRQSRHAVFADGLIKEFVESSVTRFLMVLPYDHAETAQRALVWSVACLNSLLSEPDLSLIDDLKGQVDKLEKMFTGSAHQSDDMIKLLVEANKRNLPWLNQFERYYQIGYGVHSRWLNSTFTDKTSLIGADIARNKTLALKFLRQAGLPVPVHIPVTSEDDALQAAKHLGYPVVVKPIDLDRGIGVASGLKTLEAVKAAFINAKTHSDNIVVEQHIAGEDYRLTVLEGKLIQATQRHPASITGNGVLTISQLVDVVNTDPQRGHDNRSLLVALVIDSEAQDLLKEQGLTTESVPENGRTVRLRRTANICKGGMPERVLEKVHPDNRLLAERAAKSVGLDLAGIDFIIPDISKSWFEIGGAICEVNGQPNIGFIHPEIFGQILNWLLEGTDGRIPIAAVISSENSSEIARMLQSILSVKGLNTGVSCAQGVWVAEEAISSGNCSGYRGGRLLLTNRQTEAAVMELTFSDIQAQGFPFDECDVAAFVNLGRESGNEMACEIQRVRKAIVAHADDKETLEQVVKVEQQKIILVARDGDNPRLQAHLSAGRVGAWLEKMDGNYHLLLGTMGSSAILCNTHEVNYSDDFSDAQALDLLFASALAYALDCNAETIHQGLGQFCRQGGK